MSSLRTLLAAAFVVVLGAAQLSCKVNDYCLECETGDGGHHGDGGSGDGGGSGSGSDAGIDAGCIPSGPEVCDGKDNDCNGLVDDGTLPSVGSLCANQNGECAGGVLACTNGALVCSKKPSPEICDNKDNDCNGLVDEGDPGGGAKCGTDLGECVAGQMHCVSGALSCSGAIGGTMPPYGTAEVCNAKDDDCDGSFDEGLTNLGSCGIKTCTGGTNPGSVCNTNTDCTGGGTCQGNVGMCQLGTLSCSGGAQVCTGAVGPAFEVCDTKDNDCDGKTDEGYNTQTDPQNCGACNHVCGANLPNNGHANWACSAGGCVIASCQAGWHDNNHSATDGCEFGVCFTSGVEVCDGQDNDCNGIVDDNLGTAPSICATQGECTGAVAMCTGSTGWKCNYGPTVSTDGMGNIVAETLCDNKDNDCNGIVDDNQPNKGQACTDNNPGICQGTGSYQCNGANPSGPAVCVITTPGKTATAEICNNLDDDCDGVIDNGAATGNLVGMEWVNIGGGKQMMKYEASKPDASAGDGGAVNTIACSRPGVLPWTNIKYQDAEAACAAVGATLCSETRWHEACSVGPTPPTFPAATGTLIEAEYYAAISNASGFAWEENYTGGFSGIGDMVASPNNGTAMAAGAGNPRLDYPVNFTATGNYHVWVRMFGITSADAHVFVGISTTPPATPTNTATLTVGSAWTWVDAGAINVPATGTRTVSLYMADDGAKVDAIFINTGATPAPTLNGKGNKWAYANTPNTYQPAICNGQDYSSATDALVTAGGASASCYAAITTADHPFDLSGNAKEWTLAHQPGENPIRGGSYNNTADGISCPLNFTLADDTFFFPNVGFRCCR